MRKIENRRSIGIITLKGFCMGAADVVPGVSGGTMALILGIYQRLLDAIRSFDPVFIRLLMARRFTDAMVHIDLRFVVALVLGIFSALLFFTRVVPLPKLIETNPEPVFAFFFGLIVASIIILVRDLQRFDLGDYLAVTAGATAGWLIVNAVPIETPDDWWFIVFSGCLAISALLLPGISGSFVLLILKKYAYVLDAIGHFDITVIAPFAFGAAIGLIVFSRVLSWLLHRYYQRTLATIIGVLIGSLWVIWPFQERVYEIIRDKPRLLSSEPVWPQTLSTSIGIAIALTALGFILVLSLHHVANSSGAK